MLYRICDELYNFVVTVTISGFRKSLFELVENAKNGETVAFSHQGEIFTVVPKKRLSRLNEWPGLPSEARKFEDLP